MQFQSFFSKNLNLIFLLLNGMENFIVGIEGNKYLIEGFHVKKKSK